MDSRSNHNNNMLNMNFAQTNDQQLQNQQHQHQHQHGHVPLEGDAETNFNAAIDSMFAGVVDHADGVQMQEQSPSLPPRTHETNTSGNGTTNLSGNKRQRLEDSRLMSDNDMVASALNGNSHILVHGFNDHAGNSASFQPSKSQQQVLPQIQIQHSHQQQHHHQQQQIQNDGSQQANHADHVQHSHSHNNSDVPQQTIMMRNEQQQQMIPNSFSHTHMHNEQGQQQHQLQQQHNTLPPQPILPSPSHIHQGILVDTNGSVLQHAPMPPIQAHTAVARNNQQQQEHQNSNHGAQNPAVTTPAASNPANTTTPNNNAWTTDHVTEARRRMNILILRQTEAQEELRAAQEALKRAQTRVEIAKKAIEDTNEKVHQGTEELTDALLQEPSHWNAMYRKLCEFKLRFGHLDVKRTLTPASKSKGGKVEGDPDIVKLSCWVARVRLEARRPVGHPDQIEPYKIIALNRLEFNWDPRENYWMERFEELKEYFKKSGNGKRKMPTRNTSIGVWCDGQVLEFNRFKAGAKPCYITKERIALLDSIGFVWDRMQAAWMEKYEAFKRFQDEFGHNQVPVNYGDKTLFRWVAKQKRKYKNYKEGVKPALTEEQVTLLRDVHFFETGKKAFSLHQKHRRYRVRSNKGRPKSTTLIPQEVTGAMKQITADPTGANSGTTNGTASVTPATVIKAGAGAGSSDALEMQQISKLPGNEENVDDISQDIMVGTNNVITDNCPLNDARQNDPVANEDNAELDDDCNETEEVGTKLPAIGMNNSNEENRLASPLMKLESNSFHI